MSTLRVSNIEAKADASSPTIDEKVKVTNSQGRVLVQIDGKTAGITSIGINTTSTSFTIDANQNVQFAGIISSTNIDIGTGTSISSPSENTLALGTNNVERVRIDSNGNLGIGTTNPINTLHVVGNSRFISDNYPAAFFGTGAGLINFGYRDGEDGAELSSLSSMGQGRPLFLNATGSGAVLINSSTSTGTASQRLQVTGGAYVSGNLGIGSTNPSQKLDVNGNINLVSSGNYIQKTFNDETEEYILRGPSLSAYYPTISWRRSTGTATRGFIFGTHNNLGARDDWMSIWNGGLGVGTTNPQAKLHVSGGHIKVDSGYGIDFSATANSSGTMTSELLSDYEEGTWTPTLPNGGTVSSILGAFYTKIGRIVTAYLYISTSSIPSNSSEFRISGLPYTSLTGNHYSTGQIGYCGSFNLGPWRPLVINSGSYIYFHRIDGSNLTLLNSGATGLTEILISVWYYAA